MVDQFTIMTSTEPFIRESLVRLHYRGQKIFPRYSSESKKVQSAKHVAES